MDKVKVIKALYKLAQKQQRVINKIAEEVGISPIELGSSVSSWVDAKREVSEQLATSVREVGAKSQYLVQSAEIGSDSGGMRGTIKYPMSQLGSAESKAVLAKLKEKLTGKQVAGVLVTSVELIGAAG